MELEIIRGIASKVLDLDEAEITGDSRLTEDLGANALDVYEILSQAEERTDLDLIPASSVLASFRTVSDLAEFVRGAALGRRIR